MKKSYWHNVLWFAAGTFFGGYVLGIAKRILGR